MQLLILFINNVKLEHFVIYKVVNDARLFISFGNNMKFEYFFISKVVIDVRLSNSFGNEIKLGNDLKLFEYLIYLNNMPKLLKPSLDLIL